MVDRIDNTVEGFQEELIAVRRTSKVVKGGRIFRFSALVVVGDGNGRVGFATGKAREVPAAIQKATTFARQNMKRVDLKGNTIQHIVNAKHGGSEIVMRPAPEGTGVIAGSTMRAIFKVLGIENIVTKCIGSTTPHNVAHATIKGLLAMQNADKVAMKRGKSISEIEGQVGE